MQNLGNTAGYPGSAPLKRKVGRQRFSSWIYSRSTHYGSYRLRCASGILNVTYGCNDLNLVETAEFPELDDIPQRQVTLKETVRAQSVVLKAKKKRDSRCHKASASCKNN